MTYLVDTSVLIEILRKKEDAIAFLEERPKDTFLTSCVCVAEVMAGISREKVGNVAGKKADLVKVLESFADVLPFDFEQADLFGKIYAHLADRGELIDDMDIQIAAACAHVHAVIWTKNPKHFAKIKNLQVQPL